MKRALCLMFVLALASGMARPVLADHDHDHAATGGSAIKAETLRVIEDAEKKLLALAEATPADKYGWRPSDKVRTTGEVFLHVAAGNYFLASLAGNKPPEGIDMRNLEKNGGDKAKVIDTVKKSFDHIRQVVNATSDADLDKTVKIFDHDGTVREIFLIIAAHAHEHLGQSIAYARSNGITPPWSA
jgi:uncharacterized damage-inducible protein DinB